MAHRTSNLTEECIASLAALLDLQSPSSGSGHGQTLLEICQQPEAWLETAEVVLRNAGALRHSLLAPGAEARGILLTGSGSSLFVGECLAPALQGSLDIPVHVAGGDRILIEGNRVLPPCPPSLAVSFARSGDSPESSGAVDLLLETAPLSRHLIVTCNRDGRLATRYAGQPAVTSLFLPERTCDRSLVMTSSFSSMLVAGHFLRLLRCEPQYLSQTEHIAAIAHRFLLDHSAALAAVAASHCTSAVYLGSACRFGAARESALKMLEMTAGRVRTIAETYLGLRHGPMSAVHGDTIIVCYLASDPLTRAYEVDVIDELNEKDLGAARVFVGENIPAGLVRPGDFVLECPGLGQAGDELAPLIDVLAGQCLGFFRCIAEGLHPDAPSDNGAISRVVRNFRIHTRAPESAA